MSGKQVFKWYVFFILLVVAIGGFIYLRIEFDRTKAIADRQIEIYLAVGAYQTLRAQETQTAVAVEAMQEITLTEAAQTRPAP